MIKSWGGWMEVLNTADREHSMKLDADNIADGVKNCEVQDALKKIVWVLQFDLLINTRR